MRPLLVLSCPVPKFKSALRSCECLQWDSVYWTRLAREWNPPPPPPQCSPYREDTQISSSSLLILYIILDKINSKVPPQSPFPVSPTIPYINNFVPTARSGGWCVRQKWCVTLKVWEWQKKTKWQTRSGLGRSGGVTDNFECWKTD